MPVGHDWNYFVFVYSDILQDKSKQVELGWRTVCDAAFRGPYDW